jgi:hypothetical protein
MWLATEPPACSISSLSPATIFVCVGGVGESVHGALDKEATSYNDIFDAFRLALKFYHFEERID